MTPKQVGTDTEVLSVSQLNKEARKLLEDRFTRINVEGEVGSINIPPSGHWYFTLKDELAQIDCVLFAGNNRDVSFLPKIGDKIQVTGRISLYEPRGNYQLIGATIKHAGAGDLQKIFAALKEKLEDEGLFSDEHKKKVPEDPRIIAMITSPKGAALHDVLTVLKRRAPTIKVYLLPTSVQGPRSSKEIIKALKQADKLKGALKPDVVLVTRGGGSPEDMWTFNEEAVVRAMHACSLPIVSAVGHEIDFTLADFVADKRAATPSVAAELLSPDNHKRLELFEKHAQQLVQSMERRLKTCSTTIQHLTQRLRHPADYIQRQAQRVDMANNRIARATENILQLHKGKPQHYMQNLQKSWHHIIQRHNNQLNQAIERLRLVNPLNILQRGYSVLRDSENNILRKATQVKTGAIIQAQLYEGNLTCQVQNVQDEPGQNNS